MTSELNPESSARSTYHSPCESTHAKLLHKEFAAPFTMLDVERMAVSYAPDDYPHDVNDPALFELACRVASSGSVEIWNGVGKWHLLGLPIWRTEEVKFVGVGAFRREIEESVTTVRRALADCNGEADEHASQPSYPLHCLERWAQAVADRQRLQDRLQAKSHQCDALEQQLVASGKMLHVLDRLAGQLRISDRPEKFQILALTALLETMSVEHLAWVPANPHDSVSLVGQTSVDPDRIRRVVLEATGQANAAVRRSYSENRVADTIWGMDFPTIRSITIVTGDDERPGGWLVAINKNSGVGFSSHDTALMRPVASLLNVYRKNLNLYVDLKELLFGVVRAMTSAIDAKDPYTRGHSERVARIAVCLGRQMMLCTDDLSNLYLAGLLHDVGKIGIEDHVLKKAGALTPSEYRHVMSHVEIGVSILRELKRLRHVLPGILHHHERYAGGGYPDGIKGEDIPQIARILAVADSFDAMSSDRPYRRRRSPAEVEEIMRSGANIQWDPRVVEAALARWHELCAIQNRGLGESLRVAVGDALHQDYPGPDGSRIPAKSA